MNRLFVLGAVCSALVVSGCSSVVKDHGLDYQTAQSNEKALIVPEGSQPVQDKLVIPNEAQVADLESTGEFDAPRAPFLYQPLANVSFSLLGEEATMHLPVEVSRSKALFKSYLESLATEDEPEPVASETNDTLTSKPLLLEERGFWARTWDSITRLYPARHELQVTFNEGVSGTGTDVSIKVQVIKDDEEPKYSALNDDQAPTALVLDAWYHVAKKISEDSVLLSEQGRSDVLRSPIWVNQKGEYAYFLGQSFEPSTIDEFIANQPDFYVIDEGVKSLSMVPSEEVARVGDVVELTFPVRGQGGTTKQMKLFNVYRRDLDDVEWTHRTYPYEVVRQQEGYFLKVDTSAVELSNLISYRIFSMFEK